jgi:hypothetical protein
MKSQIMKWSVRRNLALPLLALLALTGAAYAQGAGSELRAKDEADKKAAEEYIDRMQTDEKYRQTLQNQQAPPTSNDPWGSVRPTTTPAKPAAKPATGAAKPAGGVAKSATGAVKPAIGPAASATGTTPKGQ